MENEHITPENKYLKDFDKWNEQKKKIDTKANFLLIHEREIWWSSAGLNIGDEENGTNQDFERPVLIIKKFNNRVCLVLPLTTQKGHPNFYFEIYYENQSGFVILSQLKLISVKRLKRQISKGLSYKQFNEIKNKLLELIK
jgi:mRNA-degrading endonuclease toxin of MazEF toxin-antitoxin module